LSDPSLGRKNPNVRKKAGHYLGGVHSASVGEVVFQQRPQSASPLASSPLVACRIQPGSVDSTMDTLRLVEDVAGSRTFAPQTPRLKGQPTTSQRGAPSGSWLLPSEEGAGAGEGLGPGGKKWKRPPPGVPEPDIANPLLGKHEMSRLGEPGSEQWHGSAGHRTWHKFYRGGPDSARKMLRKIEEPGIGNLGRRCWSEPPDDLPEYPRVEGMGPSRRGRGPEKVRTFRSPTNFDADVPEIVFNKPKGHVWRAEYTGDADHAEAPSPRGGGPPAGEFGDRHVSMENLVGMPSRQANEKPSSKRTHKFGPNGFRRAMEDDDEYEAARNDCQQYVKEFEGAAGQPHWERRCLPFTNLRHLQGKKMATGHPQTKSQVGQATFNQAGPAPYYEEPTPYEDFQGHFGPAAGISTRRANEGWDTKAELQLGGPAVTHGMSRGYRNGRRQYEDYAAYFKHCAGSPSWHDGYHYTATATADGGSPQTPREAAGSYRGISVSRGRAQSDPDIIAPQRRRAWSADPPENTTLRCDLDSTLRGTRRYPHLPVAQSCVKTLIHGQPHKELRQENGFTRFSLNTDDPKHLEGQIAAYGGRAGKTSWQERPNRSKAFVDAEWGGPCRGGEQTHAFTGDAKHLVKPRGIQKLEAPKGKKLEPYYAANIPDRDISKAKFLDCAGVATWGFDVPRSAPKRGPPPKAAAAARKARGAACRRPPAASSARRAPWE